MKILDTSYILTLLNKKDPVFKQALQMQEQFTLDKEILIISNLIEIELLTLGKGRFKEVYDEICDFIALFLDQTQNCFSYYFFSDLDHKNTRELNQISSHKKLSFTDSSLIYLSSLKANAEIVTFDIDLKKVHLS